MTDSISEQLLKKLGYQYEPKILDKTTEFLRLLDLKSAKVVSSISDYARTVLCINFAAEHLKLSFDYEDAMKISGLKKSGYQNYKRLFEKILDLKKPININEICVQLNLNEIQKYANSYFDYFCKIININDIDTSHPQYAAMSVFQAAKKKNKKITKSKFLSYSHLKPSQWTILEQQWNKIVTRYEEDLKKINTNKFSSNSDKENVDNTTNVASKIKVENKNLIEDFDIWRARMLKLAQQQFKLDRKSNEPEFLDKKWLCTHYLKWEDDDNDYFTL